MTVTFEVTPLYALPLAVIFLILWFPGKHQNLVEFIKVFWLPGLILINPEF